MGKFFGITFGDLGSRSKVTAKVKDLQNQLFALNKIPFNLEASYLLSINNWSGGTFEPKFC